MANVRIIPRLDIKGPNLIKGIQLEGLRVIGDPHAFALKYYEQGADELIYMDIVASLYERNNLSDIIKRAAENIFIPITVGGGIRSVVDAKNILRSGADKVAVNTAAIKNPQLISDISNSFGSQAMVLSVEAKYQNNGKWEAFTDNGRERTGLDIIDWVQQATALGAGEILLTSVDHEGMRKGFDIELIKQVSDVINVPLIVSGGMGDFSHFADAVSVGQADGIAIADMFHYDRLSIPDLRSQSKVAGFNVRELS